MKNLWGMIFVCVVHVLGARAQAVDYFVDACGQSVPDGAVGALRADLTCPAGTTAVRVGYGATLNMNGYTIDVPNGWGVWCTAGAKCTINGGGVGGGAFGEIRGAQAGIYLQYRARLIANDVVIRDSVTGVAAEDWHADHGATARLTNVEISGSSGTAIRVGRLKVFNVTIADNPGTGIAAGSGSRLKARGLTVRDNAYSAECDVYGCTGIDVGELSGTSLIVRGNAGIGIHARRVRLRKSTVIDNVRAGSLKGLVVFEEPRLRSVACDTSFGWGSRSSTHWGVCALDDAP